jgi:tetratricopeptide (TPR) repeat protein
VFFAYAEGRVTEGRGDFTRARDIFAEAFEMARKSRQEDLALEALTRWSRLVSLTSKAGEVRPLIDAGIPEARNSGRMDIVFNLMSVRAWDYSESGRHDLAMEEINKIRVEAEALGYLSQLVYAFSGLSGLAVELSRWEEATGYARQASELAERLGNELVLGHTLALQCASEVRRDLLPDAQAHGERAIAVLSKLSPTDSLPIAHAYLCEAYARASILDKALEHYDLAIRLAENLGMIWWRNKVREELYPLIHGGKAPPALPATETGTTETAPQ